MDTICQCCGRRESRWMVRQAEFHVAKIANWKVQLCEACSERVEEVLIIALQPPRQERP